jgi:subtilisin family serine protease
MINISIHHKNRLATLAGAAVLAIAMAGCNKDVVKSDLQEIASQAGDGVPVFMPVEVGARYMPNEILVKFTEGTTASVRAAVLEKIGGKVKENIFTPAMKFAGQKDGIYLVQTPLAALEAIARVTGAEVEYAELNYIYNHFATSNDTYYSSGSLWGMYGDASSPSNQFGSQAAEAWAAGNTGSSEVYVGIIDEGYMITHSDLAANVGKNPGETAGNGRDDDGNGLVDDVYGWDFAGNNNTVFDGAGDDHGTHVAGTIGAAGGNSKGVVGVCWNVKMLNAKFLGSTGGTTANAIKAVDYFTNLKNKGLNIVATNNSWGGGGYSASLESAIIRANTAGILFIAAAGNSGTNNDVTASFPSNYNVDNVIAVAATTSTGGLASFSQYGASTVDLGAPGNGIWSTVPKSSKGKVVESYASYSGTSMATPHVTGAAALYKASHSTATAADIKAAILGSVISTSSLSGKCATGGRLDVSSF